MNKDVPDTKWSLVTVGETSEVYSKIKEWQDIFFKEIQIGDALPAVQFCSKLGGKGIIHSWQCVLIIVEESGN